MNPRHLHRLALPTALLIAITANAGIKIDPDLLDVNPESPTPITLDLERVTIQEAFDALCQAARVPCRVDVKRPQADKMIDIQFNETPFAEAMLRLAREADLSLSRFNGYVWYDTFDLPKRSSASNHGANWVHGPLSHAGPFCGVLDRVEYSQSINLENPERISRSMDLVVATVPEPQVMIYSTRAFLKLPKVVDERKHLLSDKVENDADVQRPSNNVDTSFGMLAVPEPPGRELTEVTAVRRYDIVRKFRRIEIDGPELNAGTHFQSDGVDVTLAPMIDRRDLGKEYTLTLKPASSDAPSIQLLSDGLLCAMIDDKDRVMRPLWRSPETGKDSAKVLYRFCPLFPQDGNAQPTRLVILLPLQGQTVTPTYHFQHIPLQPALPQ